MHSTLSSTSSLLARAWARENRARPWRTSSSHSTSTVARSKSTPPSRPAIRLAVKAPIEKAHVSRPRQATPMADSPSAAAFVKPVPSSAAPSVVGNEKAPVSRPRQVTPTTESSSFSGTAITLPSIRAVNEMCARVLARNPREAPPRISRAPSAKFAFPVAAFVKPVPSAAAPSVVGNEKVPLSRPPQATPTTESQFESSSTFRSLLIAALSRMEREHPYRLKHPPAAAPVKPAVPAPAQVKTALRTVKITLPAAAPTKFFFPTAAPAKPRLAAAAPVKVATARWVDSQIGWHRLRRMGAPPNFNSWLMSQAVERIQQPATPAESPSWARASPIMSCPSSIMTTAANPSSTMTPTSNSSSIPGFSPVDIKIVPLSELIRKATRPSYKFDSETAALISALDKPLDLSDHHRALNSLQETMRQARITYLRSFKEIADDMKENAPPRLPTFPSITAAPKATRFYSRSFTKPITFRMTQPPPTLKGILRKSHDKWPKLAKKVAFSGKNTVREFPKYMSYEHADVNPERIIGRVIGWYTDRKGQDFTMLGEGPYSHIDCRNPGCNKRRLHARDRRYRPCGGP